MADGGVSLNARVEVVRREVVGMRLVDLPSDRLVALDHDLQRQARETVERLETFGNEARKALAEGDEGGWSRARQRASEELRRYETLDDQLRLLTDARHTRQLADKMTAQLGSPARLQAYEYSLIALILLVVGMLGYEFAVPVDPQTLFLFDVIDVSACAVFIADFFWRLRLAGSTRWFWRTHWLDLITSIPVPTSPLRAGRLVRLVRLLRLLRLLRVFRVLSVFWRGLDPLLTAMNVQVLQRSFAGLLGALVIGAVGIWLLEGGSPGALQDVGETLWWSFTTVVTGGFADLKNPTTWAGRGLTAVLVLAGIVVVGVFTASLTSVLVHEEETTAAVIALDDRLTHTLAELKEQLDTREG